MGVGIIGAGSAYIGAGSSGKDAKTELENAIKRVKQERESYERAADDRKITELDNRLNNLQNRLDKINERDGECQTCKNRKYQDGSDDPGVSFKTASKVGPEGAAAAVRGHEYEHVNRNQAKAAREGKEVVYQSVRIKTAICPECGESYVAGGETTTVTKTKPENEVEKPGKKAENPAEQNGQSPAEELQNKFSVGLNDSEIGQLFNVVA